MAYKLDPKTLERLNALGAAKQKSLDTLIEDAVQRFLTQEEAELEEITVARERLDEYEQTGEHVEHEKVSKWLKDLASGKNTPCPVPET